MSLTSYRTAPPRDIRQTAAFAWRSLPFLEHVPKKLLDFFEFDMLQLLEYERFLFDHVILCVGQAL